MFPKEQSFVAAYENQMATIKDLNRQAILHDYRTRLSLYLSKQKEYLEKQGLPKDYGFLDTSVIFRNHHHGTCIAIMEEWWDETAQQVTKENITLPLMLYRRGLRTLELAGLGNDMDLNHLPVCQQEPNRGDVLAKPKGFEKMADLARKLSKDTNHVRVDFYDINGQIYFGELTFYHNGGHEPFVPDTFDKKLGSFLNLPK